MLDYKALSLSGVAYQVNPFWATLSLSRLVWGEHPHHIPQSLTLSSVTFPNVWHLFLDILLPSQTHFPKYNSFLFPVSFQFLSFLSLLTTPLSFTFPSFLTKVSSSCSISPIIQSFAKYCNYFLFNIILIYPLITIPGTRTFIHTLLTSWLIAFSLTSLQLPSSQSIQNATAEVIFLSCCSDHIIPTVQILSLISYHVKCCLCSHFPFTSQNLSSH